MRSKKEVEEAIKDFIKMPPDEFLSKYGLQNTHEAVGFIKALGWITKKVR